ncbi:MAG: DUF2085 domain-containing protein [Methanomassiliicoccales archaeon]|nr:DUF2085 domain-containing protein [Methanomassiliicoccales archaeon]
MWKELRPIRKAEVVIFVIFLTFTSLVFLAPFTLTPGQVTDLSGKVGTIDNQAQIDQMNPFAAAIYWFGDGNCHQVAARSYYLNGNEMPFCSRDIGVFVGLAAGMGLVLVARPKARILIPLLGLVPIAIDGGLQLLTSYESSNVLRLATGLLAGVSVALLIHAFAVRMLETKASGKGRPEGH